MRSSLPNWFHLGHYPRTVLIFSTSSGKGERGCRCGGDDRLESWWQSADAKHGLAMVELPCYTERERGVSGARFSQILYQHTPLLVVQECKNRSTRSYYRFAVDHAWWDAWRDIQGKLVEVIKRRVVGSDAEEIKHLQRMPYLKAVIMEGLR